jgi:rubrerythrin
MSQEVASVTDIAALPISDPWLNLRTDPIAPYSHGASERLVRALEAYACSEAHDLSQYQELAQRSDEPSVKLLLSVIIDDEHHHQALLESMVRRLQDGTPSDAFPITSADADASPLSDLELAAMLRTLIRDEHEGARHLRHVGRQETAACSGLYTTLLDSIARDSEKHAAILRYLLARLERRAT